MLRPQYVDYVIEHFMLKLSGPSKEALREVILEPNIPIKEIADKWGVTRQSVGKNLGRFTRIHYGITGAIKLL